MRLKQLLQNKQFLVTLVFICAFPFCAKLIAVGKFAYIMVLPLFALFVTLGLTFKNGFFYILIISPFLGRVLWEQGNLSIYITDLLFPIIMVSFLLSKKRLSENASTLSFSRVERHLLLSLSILLASSILSLFINVVGITGISLLTSGVFIFRLLQLVVMLFVILKQFANEKVALTTTKIVCWAMFLQLPVILFQYLVLYVGVDGDDIHQVGTMPHHHSVIAMVAVSVIPLVFFYYKKDLKIAKKLLLAVCVFALLYLVFLSETRSLMLGIAIALFFYGFFSIRFSIKTLYAALGIIVACTIFWYLPITQKLVSETFMSGDSSGLDPSSYSRLFIWKGAWESFVKASLSQKLFGQGIGLYSTIEYDFVIWGGARSATGAHNNFLHVLVETGVVGLAAWLYHFAVILYFSFKKGACKLVRHSLGLVTLALIFSGIGQETFWLQSAFGSYWFFFTIILALVLNQYRIKNKTVKQLARSVE